MYRLTFLAALLLFSAAPLAGQNTVFNGHFNTNDSGWTDPPFGTFVRDATLDVNGSPASGSGLLTNNGTLFAFSSQTVRQCQPVTGGTAYYWGGSIRFPENETTTGNTQVVVAFYLTANCTDAILGGETGTVRDPDTDARGVWHTSNFGSIATGFTAPPGSQSVQIQLFAVKTQMAGSRSVNFDGIFFAQVGTVPVALMRFAVD